MNILLPLTLQSDDDPTNNTRKIQVSVFTLGFIYIYTHAVNQCVSVAHWKRFIRLRFSEILALFPPWKCINDIPCKASLKTLLLGRKTQLHNGIVIHASQCFSNVTVIMKNILTFPLHSRSRANLISKAKRERTHWIIIVFNALVIIPGFMMVF